MDEATERKKLFWHSRRGMLELDVLLVPFLEQAYGDLAQDDKELYKKLLESEDTDMFSWFMQHTQPADPDMQRIVRIILERVQPK